MKSTKELVRDGKKYLPEEHINLIHYSKLKPKITFESHSHEAKETYETELKEHQKRSKLKSVRSL